MSVHYLIVRSKSRSTSPNSYLAIEPREREYDDALNGYLSAQPRRANENNDFVTLCNKQHRKRAADRYIDCESFRMLLL